MRLMALDIGEKRIGLATTDELGIAIWPQPTLFRKNLSRDLEEILQHIQDHSIETLVVGLPLNMDGTEGAQAKKVRNFISQLRRSMERKGIAVPLEWCDERLTSWEAERRLKEKGIKGKDRKSEVDALAACLILEDYLERNRK
jgi:putative Holliday junction resolvase